MSPEGGHPGAVPGSPESADSVALFRRYSDLESPVDAPPVPALADRLAGCLLGTALGDALGLPAEGLPAARIARWFPDLDGFHLLGGIGFVSDDTEQTTLVAEVLSLHPLDPEAAAAHLRRELACWFLRLPWGVGWATARACLRILAGRNDSGVPSAGNGAAMRSAVIGVFYCGDPGRRLAMIERLARVTHTDPRAVEGAGFVAEVAARCALSAPGTPRDGILRAAHAVLPPGETADAVATALDAAAAGAWPASLVPTGYVVHTAAAASWLFQRHGAVPLEAIQAAVRAGGDTDSVAAIVGAWAGALHGAGGLPPGLLAKLHDGPYGPSHLRALAASLAAAANGRPVPPPRYSRGAAMLRNLLLMPVILGHGLRRVLPW